MKANAYYNEFDPFAAAWLRELIKAGHIAPGEVDERSIIDVKADDVREFTQWHWFAGIGTWSYALRQSGWADDRPVWTGSPPCQPFSTAGKQRGKEDERHLAPHWLDLVSECRPPVVFGEQVQAAIRHEWLDDLQAHLEAENYACGAIVLPACGIGAPHIRQRLWFVAEKLGNTELHGSHEKRELRGAQEKRRVCELERPSAAIRMGDADSEGLQRHRQPGKFNGKEGREVEAGLCCAASGTGWMADTSDNASIKRSSSTNSFWRAPDWLYCRDGKWRPVESGTFPLVNGAAARVGRLRGYGNGIVAPLAQAFIEACMSKEIKQHGED